MSRMEAEPADLTQGGWMKSTGSPAWMGFRRSNRMESRRSCPMNQVGDTVSLDLDFLLHPTTGQRLMVTRIASRTQPEIHCTPSHPAELDRRNDHGCGPGRGASGDPQSSGRGRQVPAVQHERGSVPVARFIRSLDSRPHRAKPVGKANRTVTSPKAYSATLDLGGRPTRRKKRNTARYRRAGDIPLRRGFPGFGAIPG